MILYMCGDNMNLKDFVKDIETQIKVNNNSNYKERLLESYQVIKYDLKDKETFEKSNVKIGAYTYQELTFFERMNNEKYAQLITSSAWDMISAYKTSISTPDLGDKLSSFGNIGKTPYREEYIKNGYIIEEDNNKHIK